MHMHRLKRNMTKIHDDCFSYTEALKTEQGIKVAIHMTVAYMSMMTDDQRLAIMDNFCKFCGGLDRHCSCRRC